MSDLQIGLLVIGAAAVAGVLIYNRLQERGLRRKAERAFAEKHPDVLLETPPQRREPTLEPPPRREPTFEPPSATPSTAAPEPVDARMDYVIELAGGRSAGLRRDWATLEQRFARRAMLSERPNGLAAILQMVSRSGAVSETELGEFRMRVEALAARHGAAVRAPDVHEALAAAQALDQACAEVDVQIALHVLGGKPFTQEAGPFSVAPRSDGITLLLDVPRTPDLSRSYDAMVRAARGLGGRLVDDNGTALDDRALAAIGAQVEGLRARLGELGIEPGSTLALRLFS